MKIPNIILMPFLVLALIAAHQFWFNFKTYFGENPDLYPIIGAFIAIHGAIIGIIWYIKKYGLK